MRLKDRLKAQAARTAFGRRMLEDRRYRIVTTAAASLAVNLAYALYHWALGLGLPSWWMMAMGGYYTVLGAARFAAVLCSRRQRDTELFVRKVCGGLLILLSLVLAGVNYVSLSEHIATKHSIIPMITIAAYTFTKLTLAILRAVRQRKEPSPLLRTIRCIGYAEVAVSVLTLQRSMLVSFEGMTEQDILWMNAWLGLAVCLFVCCLGGSLLKERNPFK